MYRKTINFIKKINYEKKQVENFIDKNHAFLKPGRYYLIQGDKTIAYLSDTDEKQLVNKITNVSTKNIDSVYSITKLTLKRVVGVIFSVRNASKHESFGGSLIMLTYDGDVKVFSFSEKKVMTFLNDKEKYYAIKEANLKLSGYFKTSILKFTDPELCYVEKYIDYNEYSNWSLKEKDRAIETIFHGYSSYFQTFNPKKVAVVTVGSIISVFKENVNNSEINSYIDKYFFEDIYNLEIPLVNLHGDLNINNILLNEADYYLIDFERFGKLPFFYDVMNFFCTGLPSYDYYYFDHFFKGKYDVYLSDLFKKLGVDYNFLSKEQYTILFVIYRINFFYGINTIKIEGFLNEAVNIFSSMEGLCKNQRG